MSDTVVIPYPNPEPSCIAVLVGPFGVGGMYDIGSEICLQEYGQALLDSLQVALTGAGKERFTKPLTLAQAQVAGGNYAYYWLYPPNENRREWWIQADVADGGGSWQCEALLRSPNFFKGGVVTVDGVVTQPGKWVFKSPGVPTWEYSGS